MLITFVHIYVHSVIYGFLCLELSYKREWFYRIQIPSGHLSGNRSRLNGSRSGIGLLSTQT